MERIITTWVENGTQYTITAKPLIENTASSNTPDHMVSIFEYLGGRTPAAGTGDKVYKYAKQTGARYETKEIDTRSYTGKIMLYERSFLDAYFNQTIDKSDNVTVTNDDYDDDLPF